MRTPIMLPRFLKENTDQKKCWVWPGCRTGKGYARVNLSKGKYMLLHRYMYELHKGKIPESLVIDHLCRNRACGNPSHLEAVTQTENKIRGVGPTAINFRKTHCVHGHEFTEENTNLRKDGSRECRKCKVLNRSIGKIAILHYSPRNKVNALCGEESSEIKRTYKKEDVTCKNCLKTDVFNDLLA